MHINCDIILFLNHIDSLAISEHNDCIPYSKIKFTMTGMKSDMNLDNVYTLISKITRIYTRVAT